MRILLIACVFMAELAGAAGAVGQTRADIAHTYARYLAPMHEPDLARSSDTTETYRALWLRSFHEAVSVRIFPMGDSLVVITVQGNRRDSTALPARAWSILHLRDAMKRFWTTTPIPLPNGAIGLDGARWILEGRHGTQYHAVDWWSPSGEEGIEGG